MTDSGGLIRIPKDEEQRLKDAAETSRQKCEKAKQDREECKAMEKAGQSSLMFLLPIFCKMLSFLTASSCPHTWRRLNLGHLRALYSER
jgi:hypothetical protein